MSNHDLCPQCGGPLERDEADVGVGVIYGPAGCPACHWVEEPNALLTPSAVTPGPSTVDERSPDEHVEGFMRSATTPAQRAVADEIRQLRSRVDGLLTTSNLYLEETRAARRRVAEMESTLALVGRQLYVLREALEFYADEASYDEDGVVGDMVDGIEGGRVLGEQDFGVMAEQALQDVFGDDRPELPTGAAKGDPLERRDLFTDAELAVIDSTFGGGARHDDTVLALFREVAVARMKGRKP